MKMTVNQWLRIPLRIFLDLRLQRDSLYFTITIFSKEPVLESSSSSSKLYDYVFFLLGPVTLLTSFLIEGLTGWTLIGLVIYKLKFTGKAWVSIDNLGLCLLISIEKRAYDLRSL